MMTKDDITRMARAAGFVGFDGENKCLREFAALAIKPWADQLEVERKRFQELNDVAAVGMQHARAAEREACAKMVEGLFDDPNDSVLAFIVDAIRARGKHER
jgi:hypothetical protein